MLILYSKFRSAKGFFFATFKDVGLSVCLCYSKCEFMLVVPCDTFNVDILIMAIIVYFNTLLALLVVSFLGPIIKATYSAD